SERTCAPKHVYQVPLTCGGNSPRHIGAQMRLSTYSDFSIRVLIQAALRSPERVTLDEVAGTFGVSRHHLVKVIHGLGQSEYHKTRGIHPCSPARGHPIWATSFE